MLVSIISSKKYWISVCFIGLGFVFMFSLVEYFMQYGISFLDTFLEQRIYNQQWVRFLLSRLVGGLAYGMIMGYYFELRKRKSNR